MTNVLRRRTVVKVNLEFTGSRIVLVIRLTLECQVFLHRCESIYRYREVVIVTMSSL